MGDFLAGLPTVLIATAGGYLLGSVPLAYLISKRHSGVDIFEVGTGLPGASNVMRNVGKLPAVMVFLGDMAKGALAILLGNVMGVESPWLLLPAGAVVLGHWKSMFTGFRGGDGLVTLGGAIIALFPLYGFISAAVASVVALGGQKMPYTSLLNVVFGYAVLAGLTVYDPLAVYDPGGSETPLVFGMGGLCGLVLAHALFGHRRRNRAGDEWESDDEWDEVTDSPGATEQS